MSPLLFGQWKLASLYLFVSMAMLGCGKKADQLSVRRVSSDGQLAIRYLWDDLAIIRISEFRIVKARYVGPPEYVWQTGDKIERDLVSHVEKIHVEWDQRMLAGRGRIPQKPLEGVKFFVLGSSGLTFFESEAEFENAVAPPRGWDFTKPSDLLELEK